MENESVGGSVGFVGGTCHDDNDQSDSVDDDDDDVAEYSNDVGHHHHHHNHHHNELNCVDDGDIDVDERLQLYQPSLHEQQQQLQQKAQQKQKPQQQVQIQTRPKISTSITIDHSQRQQRFTQQRSILKNSTERSSNQDEQELLEAKKQMILRRRRLFSHYRQYEQWRRRQFSYDPCYYRATPLPIGQQAAYNHNNNNTYNNSTSGGHGAFRRRRQYRRQYSCAEREDSRESRESSSLQRYKGASLIASDSFNVGSHNSFEQQQQRSQWLQQHPHIHQRQHQQQQHQHRHEQSVLQQQTIDCYSPTGTRRSHIHMLHEERSASISERCTRSRINSAIFVSSEGRGFDSIEFLRRHGSQSVLCRKAHSAENITNNGRKKSFSDNKRSWHTDEHTDSDLNATHSRQGDCDGSAIELRECRPNNVTNCNNVCGSGESRTLSVLTAHTNCDHPSTSAAAAASMSITNVVVGSISLEAPPAHIKEELHNGGGSTTSIDVKSTNGAVIVHPPSSEKRQRPTNFAGISTKSSASRESADTVEELVLAPTVTVATAAVVPEIVAVARSRSLVRQRSSTASISPHRSPKPITLKNPRTKIAALPMVSVSGPSPPQEKPLAQPTTGTEYL